MLRERALRLYRAILREHRRSLPDEMREVGDKFVRHEFRLHKKASPEIAGGFLRGWEEYLSSLRGQSLGAYIDEDKLADLSEEQQSKLRDLRAEIFKEDS